MQECLKIKRKGKVMIFIYSVACIYRLVIACFVGLLTYWWGGGVDYTIFSIVACFLLLMRLNADFTGESSLFLYLFYRALFCAVIYSYVILTFFYGLSQASNAM